MPARAIRFALGASVLVCLLTATHASAAIDEGTYTVLNPEVLVDPATSTTDGGFVSCPAGQRIVGQGAFWHQPGAGPDPSNATVAWMGSNTPTSDGLGMFSSGRTSSTRYRQSVLLCLPSSVIGTAYTTVTGDSTAAEDNDAGGYLFCPAGQRVVSGGAFWHLPGAGPNQALAASSWIASSSPTTDGRGWYVAGHNDVGAPKVLTTVIHCLPSAGFGAYSVVAADSPAVSGGQVAGGFVSCPSGQRIVTGGAFWHAPAQPTVPFSAVDTLLGSSTPTTDARGWYADGRNRFASPAELQTVLLCVTPVVPAAPVAPVAPAIVPVATPTGQRAAAIKRCKKKFPKGTKKRKKCIRRAKRLPV